VCDRCGGPVRKLMSAPAVQFKGSGWHVSDYPRTGAGSKPDAGKSEGEGAAKADASEPAKPAEPSGSGAPSPSPAGEGTKPSSS